MNSFTYFSAEDFLERKIRNFECNIPIIIDDISSDNFARVKEKLIANFGENAAIIVPEGDASMRTLSGKLDYHRKIIIDCSDFTARDYFTYGDLIEIIARLRDPDGCPWDRAQTHASIRSDAIEEAYELAEAVDLMDRDKMVEESGDVLLQGLFHAVMASEQGTFTPVDMINGLCNKLIFRHTHIFGDTKATNPDEALKNWEQAKAKEKGYKSLEDKIDSVPVTFGALMRANKVQKIIKKTGFDFLSVDDAADKITEELRELKEAPTAEEREKEGGDLLFAVVNTLRMYGVDPEIALTGTTSRFIRRFLYVEERCAEEGVELKKENLLIMEGFYGEAKKVVG